MKDFQRTDECSSLARSGPSQDSPAQEGAMGAPKRGFHNKRTERCFKLPLSTGPIKTEEPWQSEATPRGFRLPPVKSPGIQDCGTKGLKCPKLTYSAVVRWSAVDDFIPP